MVNRIVECALTQPIVGAEGMPSRLLRPTRMYLALIASLLFGIAGICLSRATLWTPSSLFLQGPIFAIAFRPSDGISV